jgi:hypothetical protein
LAPAQDVAGCPFCQGEARLVRHRQAERPTEHLAKGAHRPGALERARYPFLP